MFEEHKKELNDAADKAIEAIKEKGRSENLINTIDSLKDSACTYIDQIAASAQAKDSEVPGDTLDTHVQGIAEHFKKLIQLPDIILVFIPNRRLGSPFPRSAANRKINIKT